MKKILVLAALFSLCASSAFAAYTAYQDGAAVGSGTPTMTFKSSKSVQIEYTGGATANSQNYSYVCGAYHSSGTKTFGSSSGDTKIFSTDTTGATLPSAPSTASASAGFTWTAL